MTNIMANPRFLIGKSSDEMSHGFHSYVDLKGYWINCNYMFYYVLSANFKHSNSMM
jgi:hypothetical protein